MPRRSKNAIRIWLNCRLMMTSLQTSDWNVPIMNFRMNMSSTDVCEGRNPSWRLAVGLKWLIQISLLTIRYESFKWQTHSSSMSSTLSEQQFDKVDWPFHMLTVDLVSVWFYTFPMMFSDIPPTHECIADSALSIEPTENKTNETLEVRWICYCCCQFDFNSPFALWPRLFDSFSRFKIFILVI